MVSLKEFKQLPAEDQLAEIERLELIIELTERAAQDNHKAMQQQLSKLMIWLNWAYGHYKGEL